jgi:IS30 family transposase
VALRIWAGLTWDQVVEMCDWKQVRMATDMGLSTSATHMPGDSLWQRGTNENTGLLRQYFPRVTDLSGHSQPTGTGSQPSLATSPADG